MQTNELICKFKLSHDMPFLCQYTYKIWYILVQYVGIYILKYSNTLIYRTYIQEKSKRERWNMTPSQKCCFVFIRLKKSKGVLLQKLLATSYCQLVFMIPLDKVVVDFCLGSTKLESVIRPLKISFIVSIPSPIQYQKAQQQSTYIHFYSNSY